MTEQEAIEIIWEKHIDTEFYFAEHDRYPKYYDFEFDQATLIAAQALKEIQQYRAIGTVEECREAREKQMPKKCYIDSCSDHTRYKCPSCGQIELSIYKHGFHRLGRITKYCENCGQALIDENLEEIEDAISND